MSFSGPPLLEARRPPLDPHYLASLILTERRFRAAVPSTGRSWWDVVVGWAGDLWKRFTEATAAHVHLSAHTAVLLDDGLVIALIGLVVFIALRLLLASVRDTRGQMPGATALSAVQEPGELYDKGCQAAARGDYRSAILVLFNATLLRLEQMSVIHHDPSRTVNECRRAVAYRRPAVAACFDTIAHVFTAALYADVSIVQSQWNAAEAAYRDLPLAISDG